ncbi:CDP-glycerol:poly(glycerophosphate) glycerophosphotransferase [Pullulanibacillus camelliae]|uniref:CDP-glycerol:poly(Glycerophosphate) glycerophosphotransferase n=1 Tax=Pullulanibacillus camelliae TaxID=1707096 RepID=A0A8J2YP14_9BACL|nr:CDP-glycerol glycerophosphotransferase family protein [Pullulanibacillus camelliae]GGE56678.1 CDP-glycerol:poly(glycerophosphate) glycerophosphotransferase [Pullulanibacillus camelliae]
MNNLIKNFSLFSWKVTEKAFNIIVTINDTNKFQISNYNTIEMVLTSRKSEHLITLPLNKVESNEAGLYESSLSFEQLYECPPDTTLDMYIQFTNNEECIKRRLKSTDPYLEVKGHLAGQQLFFKPYTTNKANVSLKVQKAEPIAILEDMRIEKDGRFTLMGYSFHPAFPDHEANHFIIRDKEGEIDRTLRIENIERTDLKPLSSEFNMKQSGFKVSFEIKEMHDISNVSSLKLIVKYDLPHEELEEKQLVLRPFTPKSKWKKIKRIIEKKKYILSVHKKHQTVSIKISDYNLKNEVKGAIRRRWNKLKRGREARLAYRKLFTVAGNLPADKKLLIFESFSGKQFSCNPRAIYEYIIKEYPDYKTIWSVDRRYLTLFREKNIPHVRRFSLKWLFYMARAKYWITNSRLPLWIPKPKHTTYVQTWHGTPLKRLASDMDEVHMPGTTTEKYKANFHKESSKWDYLISPNRYSTEIFQRAFNFHKEMIESGYPRNDYLYNYKNDQQAIKNRMRLALDKKVILYAPTWRDDQFYGRGRYKFDLDLDLDMMKETLGDDYIIVLRMHYLVAENLDLEPYKGFAYDFSSYEDIRDLYLVADLLITDYSSVFFDYANLRRPMIFYCYDIDTYRDKLRGFYFDFERKAPGPLVKTTEEVIASIEEFEKNHFELSDSFNAFFDKFCYLEDGQASRRVVQRIFANKK